jgi:hypothetical protein
MVDQWSYFPPGDAHYNAVAAEENLSASRDRTLSKLPSTTFVLCSSSGIHRTPKVANFPEFGPACSMGRPPRNPTSNHAFSKAVRLVLENCCVVPTLSRGFVTTSFGMCPRVRSLFDVATIVKFGQPTMRPAAALVARALVVVLRLSTLSAAASPPVKISLRSSWPAHNLVVEFLSVAGLFVIYYCS